MKYSALYLYLLLFAPLLISSCDRNGDIVIFSPKEDVALGAQVNQEILNNPDEYPVLSEEEYPEAYKYLRAITEEVLSSEEVQYKDIFAYDSIKIIQNDSILNAFATPGGYIYVYTGLIKYLDSPDHLAGVIGHEIAHADQRHTSKMLQRQMGIQLLLDIALGQNQGAVTQVLQQLGSLKFSRSAETESDAFSVAYLSSTPYACTGAAGFFEKLEEEASGSGVPTFLSTHPNPDNRIENIRQAAEEMACDTTPSGSDILQKLQNSLPN
ncbi:M48 family metalloprotease [Nafulsella turpanensis]|uniref:M48 family metalloprotease n=1 Tax=Nafulsella turpanensis TaxID=1265690 RepID=UPI00034D10AD|nr:M48 family metalloprotease [Nafulsella turpanensis]